MNGIRSTCPYCGVGCGVIVSPEGVRGDPEHPANFGRLCSKGSALAETLDDSNRLLHPSIDGEEADWDAALSLVASRFQKAIAEHGPDSVAFYVSGQFFTEDYYVANKLMKGFIGSGNIDTNSRLCMASSVAGHIRAFGEDVVPGNYEDFEQADLVVLVGSNTAWCHPVLFQRLNAARSIRGTKVVVIDPRRTATCEGADLHLPLAAGTDVALFAGLLVYLSKAGSFDQDWIDAHTSGLEVSLDTARQFAGSVEQVAAITKVTPEAIRSFYAMFAKTDRSLTIYSQGVNQSSAGTDKVNAIINCHLATGRIGRPGMGPFSVTGQPNAMGGREVGGLANQLAAHMSFNDADIDRIGRFWKAANIAHRPGLKAVDLFDAVLEGRIKAIWIAATNPAVSMPRADLVRQSLEVCPFVVVSDCWPTDTTKYANVVLPAAGWSEKDGMVTNSERRISRQRSFRPPPGQAKSDWWMFAEVGRRMGWAAAFAYTNAAKVFREHAALSAFENDGRRVFDIGALASLTDAEYDDCEPLQWPLPAGGQLENGRLFSKGGFPLLDGRARFVQTEYRPVSSKPDRQRPFVLNTGRIRDQWHTMTRTGLVPRLMTHREEPFLELSPHDATKLCVGDGDLVRLETHHGATILRTKSNLGQRPGEVFVPMHWTDQFVANGPIGKLVAGICDPVSGQPELKATPVKLAPVPTLWRGLLFAKTLCAAPMNDCYFARIPSLEGQLYELRGWDVLPSSQQIRLRLMDQPPNAKLLDLSDPKSGIFRFASIINGRLAACLLISRGTRWPHPDRDTIWPLLGNLWDEPMIETLTRTIDLDAAAPPPDRKVCSCFSVGRRSIEKVIAADRLTTSLQVGKALRAGTNCGSCLPEIEEILRDTLAIM